MDHANSLQAIDLATYQQYINGVFQKNDLATEYIEVVDPCSEQVIALAPRGKQKEADLAISAASKAQHEWSMRTSVDRASYLKRMAMVIRNNRVLLAETLAREQAKVKSLAQVEIDVTAEYYDYYAGLARSYEGEIIPSDRPGEQIWLPY